MRISLARLAAAVALVRGWRQPLARVTIVLVVMLTAGFVVGVVTDLVVAYGGG